MSVMSKYKVLVRGAGELASAVGLILYRVGFKVIMTDLEVPLAIRRKVCFSEAILHGKSIVEGVNAVKSDSKNWEMVIELNKIPILIDSITLFEVINPDIYIDSRMLKSVVSDRRNESYFTIGLGPGFRVSQNCDAVIETMRGHSLGNIIWEGSAQENTGVPGELRGESIKRVIHAQFDGELKWVVDFGDLIEKSQVIGWLDDFEIKSQVEGLVRGLISPTVNIKKGMKIADIDPRGKEIDYLTISDKARNIGRGVLEAILVYLNSKNGN